MLHRISWSAWLAGTALIILSWVDVVSPVVGWTGFGIACTATLMSCIPQGHPAKAKDEDWAILTRSMVESKDHNYKAAMECFVREGAVYYDGITFGVRPENELWLAAVASSPIAELDEVRVQQDVSRTKAGFEALARLAPEIAGIVAEKKLSVSLITEFGSKGIEICRVLDGQVDWKVKGKGTEHVA